MDTKQEIIETTMELIKMPTVASNTQAIEDCLDWIKRFLSESDLVIKEFTQNNIKTLLITPKDITNIDILFNGHLDVVAGDEQQFDPHIEGDKLYGRGSLDMKGALAVLLIFAKNYLTGSKHGLLISTDEEIGGKNGCGYLIESQKINCNYFITGEPTNLSVATEEKGVIWLTIKVKGKSGHASTPWIGDNPIWKVEDLLSELKKLYPPEQDEKWISTITPTRIETNNSQNQIAEELLIKVDCRYIPEDDPQVIISKLSSIADDVEVQLVEPPLTYIEHPYTKELEVLTNRKSQRIHFASDARFFSEMGIPAVMLGAIGESMHGKDEYVTISSLIEYYHLLEKLVVKNHNV